MLNTKRVLIALVVLTICSACLSKTFIRQYSEPNEFITKVNTVARLEDDCVLVALEGYNTQTHEYFSRIQCLNPDGDKTDFFKDVYVGEPGTLGAGLFIHKSIDVMVPALAMQRDSVTILRFNWSRLNEPEYDGYEYHLSEQIQEIEEFPTAIYDYSYHFELDCVVGGRAVIDDTLRCFILDTNNRIGSDWSDLRVVNAPGMKSITGIYRPQNKDVYFLVGISDHNTGMIEEIDSVGTVFWSRDLYRVTDEFTNPVIISKNWLGSDYILLFISYQDESKILYIDALGGELYPDGDIYPVISSVYSERLDTFAGTIPLSFRLLNDDICFSYPKDGKQIQRVFRGEEITILPGSGISVNVAKSAILILILVVMIISWFPDA
jgi:hypothetical protein